MSYRLEVIPSPNFTPASQVRAFYGRPRTIELGAGHWWGDPNAGYSHDGVVNGFRNAARQVAAHAVVSAGRVTKMVDYNDAAWCTSSANPYTIAIELDPRIALGGELANQIAATLAEFIADDIIPRYGNLEWRTHKALVGPITACNPLNWVQFRQWAYDAYLAKQAPKPVPVPEWKQNLSQIPQKQLFTIANAELKNLVTGMPIKNFPAGTPIDVKGRTTVGGVEYLLSVYSFDNGQASGINSSQLRPPAPVIPEWQRNLVDTADVKLTVLPAAGTSIVNLNDLSVIAPLAKGTVVDIAKKTTVGEEYLLSSYSVANGMPNGLLASDMGVPAEPPVNEKPEWLANWRDIEDKKMYTRVDAPLVNLLTGETVKVIPINTPIDIASATEWHGLPYLNTKYSTDKQEPRGLRLVDMSDTPIAAPEEPVEPAPEQPDLEARVGLIEAFIAKLKELLAKIGINL